MTHRTGLNYGHSLAVVGGLEADRIRLEIDREADRVRASHVPGAIELAADFGLPVEDCAAVLVLVSEPKARRLMTEAREHGLGCDDLIWLAKISQELQSKADSSDHLRAIRDELAKADRERRNDLILAKFNSEDDLIPPVRLGRAERRKAERAARRKAGRS